MIGQRIFIIAYRGVERGEIGTIQENDGRTCLIKDDFGLYRRFLCVHLDCVLIPM